MPLMTSLRDRSPFLTILARLAVDGTSLAAFSAAKSTVSPSTRASLYSRTSAVSFAVSERKPTFGRRRCIGVWPPSKPALILPLPARANEPLWPRPAVLPRPEPIPRPTRVRSVRAPGAGLRSLRRKVMIDYSSTLTRYWTLLIRPRTCGLSFSSRTSLSLFRPSARTDRRWRDWVPRRPRTRRTLTVLPASLAMIQILHLLAALGRNAGRRLHACQTLHGGTHQVDRVARTGGLGQHVLHTNGFQHGAHGTTGDHTGTFRSRLHEHTRRTVAVLDGMPQRAVVQVNADHLLAGLLHRLLDGDRHFARLAIAEADLAFAITDHGQC